ncbi:MAG: hypothetical protein KAV00_18450 [Phycisphaerae bacterium]|nr:hypothetical protein [Phycisphaerae bacterium]
MNRLTQKYGANKVIFGVLILGVTLLCVWTLMNRPSAAQAADSPAEQARELKEVMSAFEGYVDIYIDVQAGQPFLADVRVKGVTHAAGSTFVHFQRRNGESWRVDADKIVAYRIRRK